MNKYNEKTANKIINKEETCIYYNNRF